MVTIKNGKVYKIGENMPVEFSNGQISPIVNPEKKKKNKDGFLQKSSFLDDGFQAHDIAPIVVTSAADIIVNGFEGLASRYEGVMDAVQYTVSDAADLFGADTYADQVRNKAKKNTVGNFVAPAKNLIEDASALGDMGRGLSNTMGGVGGMVMENILLPGSALKITGVSAYGSGRSEAYQNNATDGQSIAYGVMNAGVEVISEKIFSGLGKALNFGKAFSSADDVVASKLGGAVRRATEKAFKSPAVAKAIGNVTEYAVKSGAEGVEEVVAGLGNAVAKKLTYESDEDRKKLIKDENLLEQFIVGSIVSGIAQGGDVITSTTQGKDFVSGYTDTEQKVVDKTIEKRLAEKKKANGKVTAKDKSNIADAVKRDLERGYITLDEINEALGGDSYSRYKSYTETEKLQEEAILKKIDDISKQIDNADENANTETLRNELAKAKGTLDSLRNNSQRKDFKKKLDDEVIGLARGTRLAESYREVARRKENFNADLNKYTAKEQAIVQKAIDSGVLNNTNRTHDFVDFVARVSASKGIDFDFADNAKIKESGFAVDGAVVNGYVNENGITLNAESVKSLDSVVGHEITHVLKGTELYDSLESTITEYAKSKGIYDSRLKAIQTLYEGKNADIDAELTADLVGDLIFTDEAFINRLTSNRTLFDKIFGEIKYLARIATAGSKEARQLEKAKVLFEKAYNKTDVDTHRLTSDENINETLKSVDLEYDSESETVSFSMSSLEEAFDYNKGETDYLKARNEYVNALVKATGKTREEANRYLDSLFLIHDMIASDRDRLDYEAAVNKSAWVGNAEYGGSIDFSTLCAKRRLFTGTFDAIQEALPDTVLTDTDFLQIRNLLLENGEESPCSMCYVEGSRAKHGTYVEKWLKEYLKTNPEWKPQIADFTSTTRLEQTRLQHPEAYKAYTEAMNKLSQRKPKEASVRTDYKGEILVEFADGSSVEIKNRNGGIRFNSFSDFEIIHALDCMQVITDMARVGLNGQAYTKVKEFAESFGNTGLKINLSLVAKGVDENGRLIFDETNGMKYSEAMEIRNKYSDNVGTVIVVFNDEQLKFALADGSIDFVLPFHRSQWKKSQYALMGLPEATRDYTNIQNDRYKNPATGRAKKAPNGNIMPNEYWVSSLSGRENAQRYLDYINENSYIPKFDFLLEKKDGKWVLPEGPIGDGYFKLLIDFKMYNNEGVGAPQNPVLPEFNMPYIQQMLDNYIGGHKSFPVAHDVVNKFVEGKKNGTYSLSPLNTTPEGKYTGESIAYNPDINEDYIDIDAYEVENILKNSTLPIEEKNALVSFVREKILDKGLVFETLAKKTNNRELEAKWHNTRLAEGKAQYFMKHGAEGVKSLDAIRKEVGDRGDLFNQYMYNLLNIDRMTLLDRYGMPNKAVYGSQVTADVSKAVVDDIEAKNPDFKDFAEDVYTYVKHLRQMMVDEGLITQNTAEIWDRMYPHYIPIKRDMNVIGDVDNASLEESTRAYIGAPLKKATGGNKAIDTLFVTLANRTAQTYKAVAKNSFGVELKNALNVHNLNTAVELSQSQDLYDAMAVLDNATKISDDGNYTFTVYEDGNKIDFAIDREMYEALQPPSKLLSSTIKPIEASTKLFRNLVTNANLLFGAKNAIKDVQDVLINSQHALQTYKNIPQAVIEIWTGEGEYINEYLANGGEKTSYFDKSDKVFMDAETKRWYSFIGDINNGIEMTPRLAEYIASRKAGRSIEVSMLDAARVTTNFQAGGDVTKWMNRNGFTFLNASVQGFMQNVRNIQEARQKGLRGYIALATKFALGSIPAVVLNKMLWGDDDKYEELPDYIKDNYYILFKYGDGKFVRIPKGRTLSVIQNALQQMVDFATGDDELDLKRFTDIVIENIAPNNPMTNNIVAPFIQSAQGKAWYGGDIVPQRLQDMPEGEQYDESTDIISRWLGDKLDVSPMKINYVADQISGAIGDFVLPWLTPEAESGGGIIGRALAPLSSQFTTDSVMNNRNTGDFYDTMDELTKNANSIKATDEDVLKQKFINSINSEISELRKQQREIQNSDLPDSEKYKLVRDIQKQINQMSADAIANKDDVNVFDNYAVVFDRHYHLDSDGKWVKTDDKQLAKQYEVTQKLNISPSDYWKDREMWNDAFDYPEKYAVSKAFDFDYATYKDYLKGINKIEGEKDKNGNTINGSTKKNVIAHIESLPLSRIEKAILFKYTYPKDTTYNKEIIQYLRERTDISYADRVAILEGLGFEVKDGKVKW